MDDCALALAEDCNAPDSDGRGSGICDRHRGERGTRALNDIAIAEGMTFTVKISDKEFTVFRNWDTNSREFTLTLPTNL